MSTVKHFTIVSAIIVKDGKVLLGLRKNTRAFENMYSLPGGRKELNESPKKAVIREIKEELGIEVCNDELDFLGTEIIQSLTSRSAGKLFESHYFIVKKYTGELQNNELLKCQELKFFSPDELPFNIVPFVRDKLLELSSNSLLEESK